MIYIVAECKTILMIKLNLFFKQLSLGVLFGCLSLYGFSEIYEVSSSDQLVNALSNAIAGDLILLASGTYTTSSSSLESFTRDGSTYNKIYYYSGVNNGTSSNRITIRSESQNNPAVLEGNGFSEPGYVLYITGDYWLVENIKIKNGAKGLMLDNSNNSIIRDVEIFDIGQEGLHVRDGSTNTLIDNVNVHNVGKKDASLGEGIYIGSDNSHWWEGDETDTGEKGLLYRLAVHNTTIINSTIGPNITAEPIDIKEGTENTVVENCTIYGLGISGIPEYVDSHIDIKGNNARIRCNTFHQNNNNKIKRAIMIVPRISDGVASSLTANTNYIHNNTFYLDENSVEVVTANNGSQDTHAWDNTRIPADGNYFDGNITESAPPEYSSSCGTFSSCDIPGGRNTSNISQVAAQLNWDSINTASNYELRWRISGGSWTNISNVTGTSESLNDLSPYTDYEWQVQSNCGSNNSSYSCSVNFTTQPNSNSNCGGQNLPDTKNIEICNITPNQSFSAGSSTPVIINYTSDIYEVKYFYRTSSDDAWNWIDKSQSPPYYINWNNIPSSAIAIRARGGDINDETTSVYEVPIVVSNINDCIDDLIIYNNSPFQNLYSSNNTITTQGTKIIQSYMQVEYRTNIVTLNESFNVQAGADFKVRIGGCN